MWGLIDLIENVYIRIILLEYVLPDITTIMKDWKSFMHQVLQEVLCD